MMGPHQAHYMAADAMHAERLAHAARMRLAGKHLHPHPGTPRVQLNGRRVAAALTSLLLAVVVATGVSAAVNSIDPAPAAPNAAAGAGGGGGGAILIR